MRTTKRLIILLCLVSGFYLLYLLSLYDDARATTYETEKKIEKKHNDSETLLKSLHPVCFSPFMFAQEENTTNNNTGGSAIRKLDYARTMKYKLIGRDVKSQSIRDMITCVLG